MEPPASHALPTAVAPPAPGLQTALDLAYLAAAVATAPVWSLRMALAGKLRTDWSGRLGYADPLPAPTRPRLLLHAVSVGEANAARRLVERLRAADVEVIVATTTDTGARRAVELFADPQGGGVVRYPFDFSRGVSRFLDAVRPDAVALMELEVWPNFVAGCARREIPVAVVNGRLSERSARRYARVGAAVRPTFARIALVAAQDETYAARFRAVGLPAERTVVTGTMKWDTRLDDRVEGSDALAAALGIDRSRPLVVAGSTAPEEHALLRDATPEGVQLLCAPRKPEWFDDAAAALPGCVRRSARRAGAGAGSSSGRFLLDTIGELSMAYALADVVVVGRTFVPLGGSDMMEPVGLGKATVVGPHVEHFQESAAALERGGGLARATRETLADTVRGLLADPGARSAMAERGRAVIRGLQGATARTAELLGELVGAAAARHRVSGPAR